MLPTKHVNDATFIYFVFFHVLVDKQFFFFLFFLPFPSKLLHDSFFICVSVTFFSADVIKLSST